MRSMIGKDIGFQQDEQDADHDFVCQVCVLFQFVKISIVLQLNEIYDWKRHWFSTR